MANGDPEVVPQFLARISHGADSGSHLGTRSISSHV